MNLWEESLARWAVQFEVGGSIAITFAQYAAQVSQLNLAKNPVRHLLSQSYTWLAIVFGDWNKRTTAKSSWVFGLFSTGAINFPQFAFNLLIFLLHCQLRNFHCISLGFWHYKVAFFSLVHNYSFVWFQKHFLEFCLSTVVASLDCRPPHEQL